MKKKRNISPQEAKEIETDLKEMTHGNKERNFFPWKLYFADVFREKGGFDVVVANPPYISYYSKNQKTAYQVRDELNLMKQSYDYIVNKKIKGRYNSMNFFIEKGLKNLSNKSSLSYIVDCSIHEKAALNIRKYIVEKYTISEIIHNISAFENVTSDQSILCLSNKKQKCSKIKWRLKFQDQFSTVSQENINENNNYTFYFSPFENILNKIEKTTNYLSNYIDYAIGVQIGGKNLIYNNETIKSFFLYDNCINKDKKLNLIKNITSIQKYDTPVYRGYINFDKNLGTDVNRTIRDANIALPKNEPFIHTKKIILRQSAAILTATIADKDSICEHKFFVFKLNNEELLSLEYLLALINSKMMTFYALEKNIIKHGEKKQPQIRIKEVVKLPIMGEGVKYQNFDTLVTQILTAKKANSQADTTGLEAEIDQLVYELYGLTEEEIQIVEESVG